MLGVTEWLIIQIFSMYKWTVEEASQGTYLPEKYNGSIQGKLRFAIGAGGIYINLYGTTEC